MPGVGIQGQSTAGGAITSSQSSFTVGGQAVLVSGSSIANHGDRPHRNATVSSGSGWMSWNGVPVAREGDSATCGHTVVNGSSTFVIE